MIRLQWEAPKSVDAVRDAVQKAINLEFATIPPYLYAKFSILPGQNSAATQRIDAIVEQEMIHMCLACNIMNAIGGTVAISPPSYPGPLPGDVGGDLVIHLLPFSEAAMEQGMKIEEPVDPIDPPVLRVALAAEAAPEPVTIGEYYMRLDAALKNLDPADWHSDRNQIWDDQYFQGQIFRVNNYADAHQAISNIVSEGEGTPTAGDPLDFQHELAHFYRFEEIYRNRLLVKDDNPVRYAWGAPLGIDWSAVYPAISDPERHDFSADPPSARVAQCECNAAYSQMVAELTQAFGGQPNRLGNAIRQMFNLRMAAIQALQSPLADGHSVAGPSFRHEPGSIGGPV